MTHHHILLDTKLKMLAEARRWKEYNTECSIRSKNIIIQKVDIVKMRNIVEQELLEELNNVCAICLNRYNFCLVSLS